VSGERWESFTIDGQLRLDLCDSSSEVDTLPMPSPTLASKPTPSGPTADTTDVTGDNDSTQHVWSCRVG